MQVDRNLAQDAVCSGRNAELVRSVGADHVIDYRRDDYTARVGQYDVVLDNVMARSPAKTARTLAPKGVFLPNSLGTTGGVFSALLRMAYAFLVLPRLGVDVRSITCDYTQPYLARLAGLLASGEMKVVIDRAYSLIDTPRAVTHMKWTPFFRPSA